MVAENLTVPSRPPQQATSRLVGDPSAVESQAGGAEYLGITIVVITDDFG
jgi:hypothetical protein